MALLMDFTDGTDTARTAVYVKIKDFNFRSDPDRYEVIVRAYRARNAAKNDKKEVPFPNGNYGFLFNVTITDYDTYLKNSVLRGNGYEPKYGLYELLKTIELNDKRYPDSPLDFKNDVSRVDHLRTARRDYVFPNPVEGVSRYYDQNLDRYQAYSGGVWGDE